MTFIMNKGVIGDLSISHEILAEPQAPVQVADAHMAKSIECTESWSPLDIKPLTDL